MAKLKALFLVFLFLLTVFTSVTTLSQSTTPEKVRIVGRVIGVEQPDFGWPMHSENLDIFYVRVEHVLKGNLLAKYIRVAYGHNSTKQPENNLPIELFSGKESWQMDLGRWDELDGVVSVSRSDQDWYGKQEKVEAPSPDKSGEGQWFSVAIIRKCVPSKGFEEEAISLENRGAISSYYLNKKLLKVRH